ncbi:glycerol-3-phosphate dehydrogenase [soil metagenome]
MTARGSFDRDAALRRLVDDRFDVLVVGGGVTGAGVALDAASRGLRTALIERDDFAAGTSSRSSKLIHGGLRYLQSGDVRLVYEALAERQHLRRNAPHLVKVLPFLIPVFAGRDGGVSKKVARALGSAMWMYDLTGGARIGKLHQRISADEAVERMPTLRRERLAGAYLYYDAQADDARLTLTIARTAALDFGAVVVNGAEVVGLVKGDGGRVVGATIAAGGDPVDVAAAVVVNATGVWSDDVRALDEGRHPASIRPAKGVHVSVPWAKIRNTAAVVVPVPGETRSVFVVPWGDVTYIGTTYTDYDGPLYDPQCTPDDVDYVLRAINSAITTPITTADVVGTWAGLRPLVRSDHGGRAAHRGRTADLSRRHRVARSAGGMVTVTGGKLTTYREMAADTVDEVVSLLSDDLLRRAGRSRTKRLALRGADGYDDMVAVDRHLAGRYGGEARTVLAMVRRDPDLGRPLVPNLPYLRAEAVYGARYEMARSLDDVLSRRTRARLLAREASAGAAADVAALVGPVLGWDDAEQARRVADYRASVARERTSAGLPDAAGAAVGA